MRRGCRGHRARGRNPAARRHPRRRTCGAAPPPAPRGEGDYLRSQARRHAVEDREGIQARNGHARPDAGRDVQEQPERVRRRQHEPPAHGRDHHDPERGGRVVARRRREATKVVQRAGDRLARVPRSRRGRGADGRRSGTPRRRRTHRHRRRRNARRPRVRAAISCACRRTRARARASGVAETQRRARRAIARSAEPHRRAREDAEGHAARRRAARARRWRSCRRSPRQGQGADGAPPPPAPPVTTPPKAVETPAPVTSLRRSSNRRRRPNRPRRRSRRRSEPPKAASRRRPNRRRSRAAEGRAAEGAAAEGAPRRRRAPKEPPGFFDEFLSNTPSWAIGGGALVILGGHRRAACRAPAQDDEVRGQHHLGHRHQDQHGVRLDRRRRRQHRRQLARERLQPRGPRQHRHRRSRSDRRSRGLPRLRPRRAGRGDPQGRAEEGPAAAGDLPQAARDPRAAQQAVGVRDRRVRALCGDQRTGRRLAEGRRRSAASSIPNNPMFAEGGAPSARPAAGTPFASSGAKAERDARGDAKPSGARLPDGRGHLDLADVRCEAEVAGRHPGRRGIRAREDREAAASRWSSIPTGRCRSPRRAAPRSRARPRPASPSRSR